MSEENGFFRKIQRRDCDICKYCQLRKYAFNYECKKHGHIIGSKPSEWKCDDFERSW